MWYLIFLRCLEPRKEDQETPYYFVNPKAVIINILAVKKPH